jgi:Protein of unknown function (DUF1064)
MSMERLSVREYRQLKRGNKYSANAIVEDGMRFDSKLEAKRYLELKQLRAIGVITWFTRQVPFHLPGGIIWRADFLIIWNRGAARSIEDWELVQVEDCKGMMTRVAINKIKQVEAIYGFKVHIITKKDLR